MTLSVVCLLGAVLTADSYEAARLQMVESALVSEGISNPRVLDSMRKTPRHEFMPANVRRLAYNDQAVAIGHRQTISPPYIVAYMTETLDPQPDDKVLEIGTGSGYQAAVLSPLVKDVYTIEIVDELSKRATATLKRLDYANVHTRSGDGYQGWPEHAPFDRIIVTCSPEDVPKPLVEQLAEGGTMLIPLGERYQQVFYLYTKTDGQLVRKELVPTLFVPMTGRSEELRDVQPDPANPQIANGDFSDRIDDRFRSWHYQRRVTSVDEGDNPHAFFENDERGRSAHILQGFPLDGRQVREIDVSLRLQIKDIGYGPDRNDKPGLIIYLYDNNRAAVGTLVIGPWRSDTTGWRTVQRRFPISRLVREAIVHVGLNGATGELHVDDLKINAVTN